MTRKSRKGPSSGLKAFDRKAHEAAKPYEGTPPVKALSVVSELGDQPQMLALSGAVLAWGVIGGRPELRRAGMRMIASHLLATGIKNLVKRNVDRTRPFAATDGADHPRPGRSESKEETSFPSGHSAGAVAVAQAFAREVPRHRGKALAGAGIIAAAQVPRCAHYPTDVGAGLAIGWLSEAMVDAAWRWWRRPRSASPIRLI